MQNYWPSLLLPQTPTSLLLAHSASSAQASLNLFSHFLQEVFADPFTVAELKSSWAVPVPLENCHYLVQPVITVILVNFLGPVLLISGFTIND
jgi:hypothetical protein